MIYSGVPVISKTSQDGGHVQQLRKKRNSGNDPKAASRKFEMDVEDQDQRIIGVCYDKGRKVIIRYILA